MVSKYSQYQCFPDLKVFSRSTYVPIPIEFFVQFWHIISEDYFAMIPDSVKNGRFSRDVTQGLMTLLFKAGDKEDVGNWCLISLLNTTYKIFAKSLGIESTASPHECH
jgi:hypothetical protein